MWYSKDYSYPIPRWKFPFRLKDGNGKSYTHENAFNNRAKLGWVDVSSPPPIHVEKENLNWENGEWVVTPKSAEELDEPNKKMWVDIRNRRNHILLETDWSQIPISNTEFGLAYGNTVIQIISANTNLDFAIYRQELRDLPDTTSNAYAVVWPTYPVITD